MPGWPGYHWYVVPRVGYPDHDSFHAAYNALASFHALPDLTDQDDGLGTRVGAITPGVTVMRVGVLMMRSFV